MAGADLLPELSGRINRWVDVAPQPHLRCRQRIRNGSERHVTHDKHVNIAIQAQFASRRGAEDECHADLVRQRRQGLTEHVDESGRLRQQRV